jgi:Uncharacterised protein family (UPF0149)
VTDAFAYAELDEILRGAGRTGAIGMSAIDGLIAALVAAPSFVHPEEWIPLIFGGRQPLHENSPELRAVKTIFNRYNEVSETLADWPPAYRPIFMVDDHGSIIARDWAVGFARDRVALQGMGRMHPADRAPPGAGPDPGLLRGRARSLAGHAGRGKVPAASYCPRRDRPCCRRRPRYLQPLSRRRSAPATRQTTPRQSHAPVAPAGTSQAITQPC